MYDCYRRHLPSTWSNSRIRRTANCPCQPLSSPLAIKIAELFAACVGLNIAVYELLIPFGTPIDLWCDSKVALAVLKKGRGRYFILLHANDTFVFNLLFYQLILFLSSVQVVHFLSCRYISSVDNPADAVSRTTAWVPGLAYVVSHYK